MYHVPEGHHGELHCLHKGTERIQRKVLNDAPKDVFTQVSYIIKITTFAHEF